MKLLTLLCCFSLVTFNVFANEYRTETGMCEFNVTESDMFNAQERELPYKFKVKYIASYNRITGQFLGIKKKVESDVNATTPVTQYELEEAAQGITFSRPSQSNPLQIHMRLSSEQVRTIATYAGSYRALYGGVTLPEINTTLSNSCGRVQSHLPLEQNDGLSYHVQWCCKYETGSPQGPGNPGKICYQNGRVVPCPIQGPGTPGKICYQNGRVVPCPIQGPGNPGKICYQNGRPVPCPIQSPGQTPGQTTRPGQNPGQQTGICHQNGRRVPCPR